MKQLALDLDMAPRALLSTFIAGPNVEVVQHVKALCEAPEAPEAPEASATPTYLWGPAGSGKTHLLEAAGQALEQRGCTVAWLGPRATAFAAFDDHWDAILMDDVHAYGAVQQHTAFNWFVNAVARRDERACTVLAAGALPPADLPLRPDLRTRLAWGLVFELHPLSEADRIAALQRAARERGIALPAEVMHYLVTRFDRDLSHLMALLDRLDRFALQTQRTPSVPLVKAMLEEQRLESRAADAPC